MATKNRMIAFTERELVANDSAAKQWFEDILALLFLIDVGLMFTAMIINCLVAVWVFILFQIVVALYGIFVLYLAYRAAIVIPPSIPLQRPLGVVLFISAHFLQFGFLGQLPISLTGYALLAVPLSILFLFNE